MSHESFSAWVLALGAVLPKVTFIFGDFRAEPSNYHGGCLASMSGQVGWATEASKGTSLHFSFDLGSCL